VTIDQAHHSHHRCQELREAQPSLQGMMSPAVLNTWHNVLSTTKRPYMFSPNERKSFRRTCTQKSMTIPRFLKKFLYFASSVACLAFVVTLQGKSHLCIPFLGIARPQTQFSHSCVCEWFIYSQDLSTYFPAAE
jgi:hypothetical protein